jgi:antirestriction protein ArdC
MGDGKKTVGEIIVDRIMTRALEEQRLPWLRPWSSTVAINWKSCKEYTGINRFLIPEGEYLTFKQALGFKFNIPKNTPSEIIIRKIDKDYPVSQEGMEKILDYVKSLIGNQSRNDLIKYAIDHRLLKRKPDGQLLRTYGTVRYYTVFNVKYMIDKDGNPVKTRLESGDIEFSPLGLPQDVAGNYCEMEDITVQHGSTDPYYNDKLDIINMPDENKFNSVESYYSTLFHELIHSTCKKGRVTRNVTPNDRSYGAFSFEELVANFGASMLCAETGIYAYQPSVVDNSVAYIQEWKRALEENPDMLIKAASTSERAKAYILKYTIDEAQSELNSGDE